MRLGIGLDVHRFKEGGDLYLGGVKIDYHQSLDGHSDADVLLHAICDALLGAAALGDIGLLFPPSDQTYKGISSLKLLEAVGKLLSENRYSIVNIDSTVIAELPKISPYRQQMCSTIANCLGISATQVSVKGTTTEQLGFTGRGEGIAAQAIATIKERE